jgi:hypothetical protein
MISRGARDTTECHGINSFSIQSCCGAGPLVTLRDAGQYITSLPKIEQQATEWQTAAELLMLIGDKRRADWVKFLRRCESRPEYP